MGQNIKEYTILRIYNILNITIKLGSVIYPVPNDVNKATRSRFF